jgi:hypothetical protein
MKNFAHPLITINTNRLERAVDSPCHRLRYSVRSSEIEPEKKPDNHQLYS